MGIALIGNSIAGREWAQLTVGDHRSQLAIEPGEDLASSASQVGHDLR